MTPFTHIDDPYRKGNSPIGIHIAARTDHRIDIDENDTAPDEDDVVTMANSHWDWLAREKFRYTAESVKVAKKLGIRGVRAGRICLRRISKTPWELVRTLKTKDGYRIQSIAAALQLCHELGNTVEVEFKGTPSMATVYRLAAIAQNLWGDQWQRAVQVKRLTNKAGWQTTLRRSKHAGFTTIAIDYHGRVEDLPDYVDHYRR